MRIPSSLGARLRVVLALTLIAAAGLILWSAVGTRWRGPDPVLPSSLDDLDPMVRASIERAATAVGERRGDLSARRRLCMVYQANDLLEAARRCWLQVTSLDDRSARAWFLLARTYDDLGRSRQAIDALERAIEARPEVPASHALRGLWLVDSGRLDEAARAIEASMAAAPGHQATWFALARLQMSRGAYGEVVSTVERQRLDRGENRLYARHLLAAAHRALGRAAEAESLGAESESRPPAFRDPWTTEMERHRTGRAHLASTAARLVGSGRYREAVPILARISDPESDDHRVPALLAQAHLGLGRPAAALGVLEGAVARFPESELLHTNLATLALGAAWQDPAYRARALSWAERAVTLDPQAGRAHLVHGQSLLAVARYPEAAEAMLRAYALDARQPAPLIEAAHFLLARQRWLEARELLAAAAALYPDRASVWIGLAKLEQVAGRPAAARDHLARAASAAHQDAGDVEAPRQPPGIATPDR